MWGSDWPFHVEPENSGVDGKSENGIAYFVVRYWPHSPELDDKKNNVVPKVEAESFKENNQLGYYFEIPGGKTAIKLWNLENFRKDYEALLRRYCLSDDR